MPSAPFTRRPVEVDGLEIYAVEGGRADGPAFLFLHGWPESAAAWGGVMRALAPDARVVAIDLPGVGGSATPPPSGRKRDLARVVRGVVSALGLDSLTLVGHDAGGQVAYAYLRGYHDTLARACIMNVAVPGVEPWSAVEANPHIWHFGFHNVPGLPETLVAGHQAAYFAYFYDRLAGPGGVGPEAREVMVGAYLRPEALTAGFDWYRAFAQDAEDNRAVAGAPVGTPVLYLRGSAEGGDLDAYLAGFREAGLTDVRGETIADSGHFAPLEQPAAVADALRRFAGL